jgi:phenylalanyl-tRNA synthetase beta chain
MAKRLKQIDQNVHWATIDITNYITHELGHPCHAFDYDKIMSLGGEIIIDEAKKGEKFITLDGENYQTVGGEIVFRAPDGTIIDLPAIKGTANTAVDEKTRNILFWIENMDAKKVRFASMTHDIRTIAAQLNEKNVDPHLAEPTLSFGVKLYQEIVGAEVASQVYDDFPGKKSPTQKYIPLSVFQRYLGLTLPHQTIISILDKLGCQVKQVGHNLEIIPPTYRPDLEIPADFVEEVARIYGYHNLPGKIMDGPLPLKRPINDTFDLEEKIKNFLSLVGLQEVYTYSLVSESLALESGHQLKNHLELANPLTDDKVYLRRSLLPSLNQVIVDNPTSKDLKVFELAKVYHPQGKKTQRPKEVMKLGMSLRIGYRTARGIVEALLDHLFVYQYQFEPNQDKTSATIQAHKQKTAHTLGIIQPLLYTSQENQTQDYALVNVELDLTNLAKVINKHPQYRPLPKTSPIIEDLTFEINPNTQVKEVINSIKQTSNLIYQVNLKDVYHNRYSFTIYYLDPKNNLSDQEVAPIRKEIVKKLKKLNCKLVGKV